MNNVKRFFFEDFEDDGLRMEDTIIAANEGPKAPTYETKDNTTVSQFWAPVWITLSLPAIIGAKIQIIQEIRKVKMIKHSIGLLRILEAKLSFAFNQYYSILGLNMISSFQ